MIFECDKCNQFQCECNKQADGWECSKCGYIPTYKELQMGVCRCSKKEDKLYNDAKI